MFKICIVSPSLNLGGIERALTTVANYLDDQGYEILFIVCLRSKTPFFTLNPTIEVMSPDFSRSGSMMNKMSFYLRLIIYLRKNILGFSPDCVLVYGDWFNPIVLMALRNTKIPVYISDRTSPTYKFSVPIRLLKKWLYPKAAGFIAQTKQAENHKRNLFGERLRTQVIPNMVPAVAKREYQNKKNFILYAGRFAWEKAPDRLIKAFSLSAEQHDYHLHMAGSGPLLDNMKSLVSSLGMENRVKFLGSVNDMGTLYKEASIFVLPSVVEGFPNALAEAMSYGLPCIIFDDISHQDFIKDGVSGLVVKNGSLQQLSQNIALLANDQPLRYSLGEEAYLKSGDWDIAKIGQQLEDFMLRSEGTEGRI